MGSKDANKEYEKDMRKLSLESISERCKRTHFQCCHICEDIECGDNTSKAKKKYLAEKQRADDYEAALKEIGGDIGDCDHKARGLDCAHYQKIAIEAFQKHKGGE